MTFSTRLWYIGCDLLITMYMKKIPYEEFTHGRRGRAVTKDGGVLDGVISKLPTGDVFICHNYSKYYNGDYMVTDKFGYEYVHELVEIGQDWEEGDYQITHIEFKEKTLEDISSGDIIKSNNETYARVYQVAHPIVFITGWFNSIEDVPLIDSGEAYVETRTFGFLKKHGCSVIEGEKNGQMEVTLEEIAKKFGVPIETLRIKD